MADKKNIVVDEQSAAAIAATNPNQKKQFVKSSLKAVAVLLVICLICGVLLAFANDLLFISDEVRFDRAMKKIYSEFALKEKKTLDADFSVNEAYGEVLSAVISVDDTAVIESKGINGYKGTVTLYVAVKADGKIVGWTIKEYSGETLMSHFNNKNVPKWYIGTDVSDYIEMNDFFVTNATMSSNAINNAINMAAFYCRNALGIGKNPEAEAVKSLLELLGADYASYEFSALALKSFSFSGETLAAHYSTSDAALKYAFSATGDKGAVNAFVYSVGGEDKIIAVKDSMNVNDRKTIASDEGIPAAAVAKAEAYHFLKLKLGSNTTVYAFVVSAQISGTDVKYTVAGLKNGYVPDSYLFEITVEKDGVNATGKIKTIEIPKGGDGFVDGHPAHGDANKLVTELVGATSANADAKFADKHVAEATESAYMIAAAVKAALAEYDAAFAS